MTESYEFLEKFNVNHIENNCSDFVILTNSIKIRLYNFYEKKSSSLCILYLKYFEKFLIIIEMGTYYILRLFMKQIFFFY